MNKPLMLALFTLLPLLHGCAGVVVAGAATTAVVANDRRTFGSVIDDQNIELKAANVLGERPELAKSSRINTVSMNGMVLLVGQTPSDDLKRDAEARVHKIEGVRHVYNELRLGKPVSIGVRSNDTWITSKVRADMLGTKNFDSTKVKVVTENSEVFLIGLVTRQEGDQAVEIARHVSGVKQVIKAFEFAQN